MSSKSFWKLMAGLALAFGTPLILLVIAPFVSLSNATPVDYTEEDGVEDGTAAYPARELYRHGSSDFGKLVYQREGCAYCHTQVVRPTYAGPDMWRAAGPKEEPTSISWGGREAEGLARETRHQDYLEEKIAPLGYQRIGPDLANVGHRITSREEMHRHLYDPKGVDRDSGMPAYKHLYRPSPFGKGMEPTDKAEALVDYLLSLKKDQKLPASMAGAN